MTLALVMLFLLLLWHTTLRPWVREIRIADQQALQTRMRRFKLFAVKKYHPAFQHIPNLRALSLDEIERRFNVDSVYDEIGR